MQPIEHQDNGVQELTREWINRVLEETGWSPHKLAKEAGVSPATIHRALKDERFVTTNTTLEKISKATKIPSPLSGRGSGFREPDALLIKDGKVISVFEMKTAGDSQAVWRLNTRAAEMVGYLPDDLVLVDQKAQPRPRDLVCAQVYDLQTGTAETVFRIYDPPYLVARTMDPDLSAKPLLIDNERVMIWGTVIRMIRNREP